MRGQASDIGTNWLLTGNLDFSRDYLQAVQQVSVDDIAHVARRYLRDDKCTVCTLDPEGSSAKITRNRRCQCGPRAKSNVLNFPTACGCWCAKMRGCRLVYLDAVFRGGLLAETSADNGVTKLFSRVLLKGTTNRTSEQIAEEVEAVGGSIGSEAGNNSFSVSLEVMQPDLGLGLDVLADVLLNATLTSPRSSNAKNPCRPPPSRARTNT